MKCETTIKGVPCNNEAEFIVDGPYVKAHKCCKSCAEYWRSRSGLYFRVDLEPVGKDHEKDQANPGN